MAIEARANVVASDVTFVLQNVCNPDLERRRRTGQVAPTGQNGVADACKEISNWISHGAYQLDLMTPGMSPRRESKRKQIRHSSNLRKKPRERPHALQR
jgi:hypothetical protein